MFFLLLVIYLIITLFFWIFFKDSSKAKKIVDNRLGICYTKFTKGTAIDCRWKTGADFRRIGALGRLPNRIKMGTHSPQSNGGAFLLLFGGCLGFYWGFTLLWIFRIFEKSLGKNFLKGSSLPSFKKEENAKRSVPQGGAPSLLFHHVHSHSSAK